MTTTPLSKKELARKRAEAASATYAMEAGALSKTGQPMIAAVLEHTERTTKAKHLAMSICTIVPAAKTNEIPDEDDLTYALHLYVPKPKQDAATSTDAGTAPPAGSAAAAPDAAVTADAPTGESATVYAWRPAKTMSFNSAMVAQDELTMSILNGVEAKADTRCLGVSGTSRRLSFTRAEFSEAFRRHLPVEAYMLPNTINDAQGVWLVYDPEFPVSSHLASGPKLDLDKDPVCVSHLLRATPFKPKWYTGKLGEKPSGGQEHVMMGYTGTVDQQSDGTHRFKRLALHGNVTFCECILASTNLWTDMIQRMFMVVNAHMWLECVARWAILLPLLIAGEVELKSQDMPMNSDARAGSSEYTCCMQIGARAVLCDLDGFYKTCLPPVSPGYIDELCLGKAALRQDQFLYQPGVMLSRPKDLETVTCLSTMAFGMFKEQVNDQNGKKRRIERLRKGLATAPDDKEAQDDLKREVDTLRTFRVMVGTDAIPYVPKSLPNFRTMTEAEGDEWVRAQLAVGRDQVSIVIYATNGSLERFEPAFEEHVTDLAQQMNFIPMPKRASETDIAPAAPPATRTKH